MASNHSSDQPETLDAGDTFVDNDLEDIFASGSAASDADDGQTGGAVVHVAVPTLQVQLKKNGQSSAGTATAPIGPSAAAAPAAAPRPKLQINIDGVPAGSTAAAQSPDRNAHAKKQPAARRIARFGAMVGALAGALLYKGCDTLLRLLNWPLCWAKSSLRDWIGAVAAVTCLTAGSAAFVGPKLFPRYEPMQMISAAAPTAASKSGSHAEAQSTQKDKQSDPARHQ